MADPASATQLYLDTTKLAYTETQMAISPRAPFQISDQPGLTAQATAVANCAAAFRQKDASTISQASLFRAAAEVNAALAMFAAINNQISNSLTTGQIQAAVATAIRSANAL